MSWCQYRLKVIKDPEEIVGQQVLGYVLGGVKVDVKSKATNGFQEVVDRHGCYCNHCSMTISLVSESMQQVCFFRKPSLGCSKEVK